MNELVKYDNFLNKLKFTGFTAMDFNFFIFLCSKLRDKDTKKIKISFDELRKNTGYIRHKNADFVSDLDRMNDKLAKVTCKIKTNSEITTFVLFTTFSINLDERILTVSVNEDFKFILNELVKNFTRFNLNEFIDLDSKYSKSLYRLLKQFRTTGIYETSVEDFKEKMGIPKSYSNRDITNKIINPFVKELQKYFIDLTCNIQYSHKRGRPVKGYIFTFKPEKLNKITETSIIAAEPVNLQNDISQEEKNKLVDDFGIELVEEYIKRTKVYNCCNPPTIRKWILEDKDKNKKPKSKNQFNDFPQRNYSKEEMNEIEKIKLKQSTNKIVDDNNI